uniref:WGS project CAEQ00000000 data, annotated contig 31 n=1 Tax=Trypanosoma congolense (strain IL3000) TaxID=1068625 RepID=F9WEU4_TRYCI|nr:unnamed protein product [Trypanosoma congolense IL3000]
MTVVFVAKKAFFSSFLWTAGDFFAQFLAAHHEVARRRIAGEKNASEGGRGHASGKDMVMAVDQGRLLFSAVFGLVLTPGLVGYGKIISRAIGAPYDNMLAAFALLTIQQLFATPLTLLLYHNTATAVRGGFNEPGFLSAHESLAITRTSGRHDAMSVERRIVADVLPYTLLASWYTFLPKAFHSYRKSKPMGRGCAAVLYVPWLAYVSYMQHTMLL